MKCLVILSALLFCNCSYSTNVMSDELQHRQRPARDLSHCDYEAINILYCDGELEGFEDEAIAILKTRMQTVNNPSMLELIGLLYEDKRDYANARKYLKMSVDMTNRLFTGSDMSYLPVFKELRRVESHCE